MKNDGSESPDILLYPILHLEYILPPAIFIIGIPDQNNGKPTIHQQHAEQQGLPILDYLLATYVGETVQTKKSIVYLHLGSFIWGWNISAIFSGTESVAPNSSSRLISVSASSVLGSIR